MCFHCWVCNSVLLQGVVSFMENTLTIGLTLFLTLCVDISEAVGRKEGPHGENTQKRLAGSSDNKGGRCSYTFIVPQQKLTGALCLNTQSSTANHSEVAALRLELVQQQEQLEKLRGQLEQEGSLAVEVRTLRKESSSMNSRIAQLYGQLLHEVMHKKDQALEQRRVENLLLNATTQVSGDLQSSLNFDSRQSRASLTNAIILIFPQALQVSSNYRELEKKYGALTSILSSQNQFIARLEKQCQCRGSSQASLVGSGLWVVCCVFRFGLHTGTETVVLSLCWSAQVTNEPPKIQSNMHPNYSSEANEMTNDVQRDQSAPPRQQDKTAHYIPSTTAHTPTDSPFISFPVTKNPGKACRIAQVLDLNLHTYNYQPSVRVI